MSNNSELLIREIESEIKNFEADLVDTAIVYKSESSHDLLRNLSSIVSLHRKEILRIITARFVLDEEYLRKVFKDSTDCFADTWSFDLHGRAVEGDVIQAMTEDRFVEVVNSLFLGKKDNTD